MAFNVPSTNNNNNSNTNSVSSCGIVAAQADQASTLIKSINLCNLAQLDRRILAFSVLPSPLNDGVWIYVLFYSALNNNNNVQLIKWNTAPDITSAADELFLSPQGASNPHHVGSLSIIWPNVNFAPTFISLVESQHTYGDAQSILHPTGPPLQIQVADNVQRTFTNIQGMPSLSQPSLLSAAGTGMSSTLLIAAYGTSIFTIPATRCPLSALSGLPQYWDGRQCTNHICIRSRSCAGNQGQIWFELFFIFLKMCSSYQQQLFTNHKIHTPYTHTQECQQPPMHLQTWLLYHNSCNIYSRYNMHTMQNRVLLSRRQFNPSMSNKWNDHSHCRQLHVHRLHLQTRTIFYWYILF